MAAPAEESPGTIGWAKAQVAVGKRQKRVLQHHSNGALWTGQLQYVYQSVPEEAPLASALLGAPVEGWPNSIWMIERPSIFS